MTEAPPKWWRSWVCAGALLPFGMAVAQTDGAANTPITLTNIQQVLQLGEGARLQTHRVDLETVITLPRANYPSNLWVQDGATSLNIVHTNSFRRQPGLRVRVRGVIAHGKDTPVFVDKAQVDVLGPGTMPEPLRLPVFHLFGREFLGRWIEQEGVVESVEPSQGACRITLSTDSGLVATIFYVVRGEPSPAQWRNRRVRMQGACITGLDAEGRVFGFELHVPGANFVAEVQSTATATNLVTQASPAITAPSLTAALASFQHLGDPPRSPANISNTLPLLTNVQQVLDLGLDTARVRPHPVRLIGVVTYPVPGHRHVYVDDGTGGIFVVYTFTDNLANRHAGQVVWVDGVAGAGPIKPWIAEARLKALGTVPLPAPKRPPMSDLASARWHGEWIEIEGAVRDVLRTTGLALLVASGESRVEVIVPYSQRWALPSEFLEARVALRGLCEVPVDFSGRPTQARLLLNESNDVRMLRPGTTNTFGRPLSRPEDYRGRIAPSDDRLKVAGTVLFQSVSGHLFIRDAVGTLQAQPLAPLIRRSSRATAIERPPLERLQPGDRIELVGAPASSAFAPRFVDAEYRRLERGQAPEPVRVTASDASSGRRDADLVTLRARVLGRESRRVDWVDHEALLLENNGIVFEALCETQGTNTLSATPRNTIVRATGICTALSQAPGHARNFRLLLRDPADLQVLGHAAPWHSLQPARILAVSSGLGALALIWIWTLRQRVARRTTELREEVAARQAAQDELHIALAAEKELNQLKSSFVSMVSHEFRTPLEVILSSSNILDRYLERLPPEKRKAQLKSIRKSVGRMNDLIEDVLLLGKFDAAGMACQPTTVNLGAFCSRVVAEIESAVSRPGTIRMQIEGTNGDAQADEGLLHHILSNLLSNALKYSPPDSPVDLTITRDGSQARFAIRDRGRGIPAADQPRLFTAFYRGSNVGQTQGSGLGLVIVKRCVDLHGGTITCESAEGQGATFTVTLPLFDATRFFRRRSPTGNGKLTHNPLTLKSPPS